MMVKQVWRWLAGLGVVGWALLHRTEHQQFIIGVAVTILTAMNPFAAAGAAVGCCCYLAFPSSSRGLRRLLYSVFSWGIGYAAGVFFYGDGPPYNQKAMLVAAAVAALAVLVFIAGGSIIKRDGNLPPWAESLLDVVFPFRSKRGDDDAT
jgi:hypothetical protein